MDDALFIAKMISEIDSGDPNSKLTIPIIIEKDLKRLIDSIYLAKKVKRKM